MPSANNRLPPCIVLGLETQIGLAVVRELGRAGVPVIGIAQEADAIGLRSRHLSRGLHVPQTRSDTMIDAINRIGKAEGECYLMAISEVNTQWLLAQRERLTHVKPILPEPRALEIVLDKQLTLAAAREVGIRVPVSVEPTSMAEVERFAESFAFPGVLKWKDPSAIAARLHRLGIEMLKAEYVYSASEFRAAAARYAVVGAWPLLQEYCRGRGLGQFFFMHRGQAVRRFQHRRIAEWPPEGGFSSVCESVPLTAHQALQAQSIALLQRIGWEGVAMVEYRLDASTGEARLMEINGRFWGSFPLAVQCRAGFALLAYALQGRGQMPVLQALRENQRCRMLSTEIKRLGRLLLQPGRIRDRSFRVQPARELARFFGDFLRPGVGYFVGSLDDPKPLFTDLLNLMRHWLRRE